MIRPYPLACPWPSKVHITSGVQLKEPLTEHELYEGVVETFLAKRAKYNLFSGHTWLQPAHRAYQYETPFMKFKSTTTLGTFFVFIFGLFLVEMNESGGFPTT